MDPEAAPQGRFHDEVEFVGWLILRGGLDVREFVAMKHGPERALLVAGIQRAEEIRARELQQFAGAVAHLMGGA